MDHGGRAFKAGFRAGMTSAIGARATDIVFRVAVILFGVVGLIAAGTIMLDASTHLFRWPKNSPAAVSPSAGP